MVIQFYNPNCFNYNDCYDLLPKIINDFFFGQILTQQQALDLSYVPVEYLVETKQIIFHLAGNNPHNLSLQQELVTSCIFHDKGAYVSPSCYKNSSVPTWNFATVILSGKPNLILDHEESINHLTRLTQYYETKNDSDWCIELLTENINQLVDKISIYKINVENCVIKLKLSQNKAEQDQLSVENYLREKGFTNVSELMRLVRKNES